MRIILASGSPRRKELLGKIIENFEVITAAVDERKIEAVIKDELKTECMYDLTFAMVREEAKAKALAVYQLENDKDALVIGADTAVCVSDEIMGKPVDRDDAVRMLRKLSLEKQFVLTGVCIIYKGLVHSFVDSSIVVFNKLDSNQEKRIQSYCDTKEPYDKAGAYGIQALGDKLVDHYEGDFDNIMGFPTEKVRAKLKELKVI